MGYGKQLFPRFPKEPEEAERMIDEELGLPLARDREIEKTMQREEREQQVLDLVGRQPENKLNIGCLDVGQGDATVIRLPTGEVIVVDCNTADANVDLVDFLKSCGVDVIDYLIITHPHYDHFSGVQKLVDNFQIRNLMEPSIERTDITEEARAEYELYCDTVNELEKHGTTILHPVASSDVYKEIGDVRLSVYGPSRAGIERAEGLEREVHTNSIVMKIGYGDFKMLFSGDVDQDGWARIAKYYDIESTVLHASHHGSVSGCDEQSMGKISPSRTIISAGRGNPFGHPDGEAVKIYKEYSTNGTRTTKNGSLGISASKDGAYIFYD